MLCLHNFWTETVAEGTDISFSICINVIESNYIGGYFGLAKLVRNLNQCKVLELVLGFRNGFLTTPAHGRGAAAWEWEANILISDHCELNSGENNSEMLSIIC